MLLPFRAAARSHVPIFEVTAVLDELVTPFGVTVADYLVVGAVRGSPNGRGAPTRLCQCLAGPPGGMTLTR